MKKKTVKNERVSKVESSKPKKDMSGEVQAVLFFALCIMVLLALVTFDVQDTGVSNQNITGETHNALGKAGAIFSNFIIQGFGVASYILPILLFSFGMRRLRGQSVPAYKILGMFFVLTFFSLFSSVTHFLVKEETAGGMVGAFLYKSLLPWIGSTGIVIILACCIPIFAKLLFNISLLSGVLSMLQKGYNALHAMMNGVHGRVKRGVLKKKMEQIYSNMLEEDNFSEVEQTNAWQSIGEENTVKTPKRRFSIASLLTRYLGITIDDNKNEAVFDDLMGLSNYDAEHNSMESPRDIEVKAMYDKKDNALNAFDDLIELPTYKMNEYRHQKSSAHEDRNAFSQKKKEMPSHLLQSQFSDSLEMLPEESTLPDVTLLGSAPKHAMTAEEKQRIKEVGDKIIACLQEFKVQADLVGYTPGPVITQYEIRPHAGVRVSKIKNLGDDLALKLEAISVRVQAPIPETDLIGIEVPNKKRQTVYFQELITSKAFEQQQSLLTMALGKTTAGHPFFADLAQMPHLLIAGSTGAGKSVCLNSIILSILYKASPKEVQFLLIDPKRVELQAYQDLPHLVHPVVTQMDLARSALQWAVEEMERRYSSMERMGSKDIIDYNAKVRRILASHSERADVLQEFPYIVILIDELADLILTATKEVETNLTRLSQLARACGMHLILATQRPSVDVVTALIKANFPSRIAFRVTSRHDSGTILDTVGAEKLLGKGDMLFKTTHIQRIHGAFVSTDEVEAVVDYWKSKERPMYTVDFAQWQMEKSMQTTTIGMFADENDPQYQEAVRFVYERGEASISAIQRRFRIGFNKAARYVEQMEQNGILENVGGPRRKVVRS